MKRWFMATTLIVVFGTLFAIVVPALLNHAVQTTVVESLRRNYGVKKSSYVRVDTSFFALLSGEVDRIHIECYKRDLSGIEAEDLTVVLSGIKFDLKELAFNRNIAIKGIDRASARIVVSETEINRYIPKNYPELKGWFLNFESNKITASAQIEMLGKLDVIFSPRLKGNRLVLDPVDANFTGIANLGLNDALNWIGDIELDIPVSNLPFDMKISRILVQDDRLIISAGN